LIDLFIRCINSVISKREHVSPIFQRLRPPGDFPRLCAQAVQLLPGDPLPLSRWGLALERVAQDVSAMTVSLPGSSLEAVSFGKRLSDHETGAQRSAPGFRRAGSPSNPLYRPPNPLNKLWLKVSSPTSWRTYPAATFVERDLEKSGLLELANYSPRHLTV